MNDAGEFVPPATPAATLYLRSRNPLADFRLVE
jgi:hypothetical protein